MKLTRIPMTVTGEKKLRIELQTLKSVQRPKIIEAITTAREHGDLKENAEYHFAREQQSFIEGKIKELEIKLSNAQVIDITKINNTGNIIFGSTVNLLNTKTSRHLKYKIVGDDEANIKINQISISSPLARVLIGKTKDEYVTLEIPSGKIEYKIISVEYI